jgi:biotin synthase
MKSLMPPDVPTTRRLVGWLRETDAGVLEVLWTAANEARKREVGDAVHLRGLLEISNCCVRECHYCGIRAGASRITRYRMKPAEVVEGARKASRLGYGTVVLQAGEDPALTADWVVSVVRAIKQETDLAVTLSLGERDDETLWRWKEAGADRYLLRFETSDRELYRRIHPARPGTWSDRVAQLQRMREMGYEIGTGVMVGIPGQKWGTLANDLELFGQLDADMIGVGPFIPSPHTPLGGNPTTANADQVPNDELTTLKVVALARLLCPEANIPSTTALATIDPARGRELGLLRGANVVMPNVTPPQYRVLYEIYPSKACIHETADVCRGCMERRIRSIGRRLGKGPGGRVARETDRGMVPASSMVPARAFV